MTRIFGWTLGIWILGCSPVLAQAERPSVELGLGVSTVWAVPYPDDGWPSQAPAGDIRIALPFSERFSFEGTLSVGGRDKRYKYWSPPVGYYVIQVKQRIVRATTRSGFHPFVTYGAAGNYSTGSVSAPYAAAIGGGIQQSLGSRMALRLDAQLLTVLVAPVGVRVTAGISLPLGR